MSGFEKLLNVFGLQVEWEDEPDATAEEARFVPEEKGEEPARPKRGTVTPRAEIPAPQGGAQVLLIEPERISDAKEICNELKAYKTVVINVEKLEKSDIIRLCDFVSGATYALGGKMKEISENVLVVAPCNVDIKTSAAEVKQEEDIYSNLEEDEEYDYNY